jgi:hypothetical protein
MDSSGEGFNSLLGWKRNNRLLSVQFSGLAGLIGELPKARIAALEGQVLILDFGSHKESFILSAAETIEKVPHLSKNSFIKAVRLSTVDTGVLILLELPAKARHRTFRNPVP